MRRFTKFANDVMPADCGLDFEGYLVTTITSHHRKSPMIVQESARGMTQVTGSEKVPTTPTMPTAR